MKIFSVDSKLYRFMTRLWDMIKLNICWLICSIPIVTIGAATVAAFTVTLKMADETEGYIVKPFFRAFRDNLKQGIPLGIISIVCGYAVIMDFRLFDIVEGNPMIFLIVGFTAAFLFTFALIYAFPLTAKYKNSLLRTMRISIDMCYKFFLRTMLLVLVLFVEICVFMYNNTTVFFAILIGPSCLFLTVSGFANYFFKTIESENASGVLTE